MTCSIPRRCLFANIGDSSELSTLDIAAPVPMNTLDRELISVVSVSLIFTNVYRCFAQIFDERNMIDLLFLPNLRLVTFL